MSWSITFIGKPENVVKALEEYSSKLNDHAKKEYDSALPHLVGLVKENFNNSEPTGNSVTVRVTASGHGYTNAVGVDEYRQCTSTVEQLYGELV